MNETIKKKICVVCDKSFTPHKYNQYIQKFCNTSRNCSNKYYRRKRNEAFLELKKLKAAGVI